MKLFIWIVRGRIDTFQLLRTYLINKYKQKCVTRIYLDNCILFNGVFDWQGHHGNDGLAGIIINVQGIVDCVLPIFLQGW